MGKLFISKSLNRGTYECYFFVIFPSFSLRLIVCPSTLIVSGVSFVSFGSFTVSIKSPTGFEEEFGGGVVIRNVILNTYENNYKAKFLESRISGYGKIEAS